MKKFFKRTVTSKKLVLCFAALIALSTAFSVLALVTPEIISDSYLSYGMQNQELLDEINAEVSMVRTLVAAFALVYIIVIVLVVRFIIGKFFWYESIIDAIPFVVSVIDNDMNFTLLNKAGRDAIGIDWKDLIGRPCNAWAHACTACNTPNCGVECLKRGQATTQYETPEGYTSKVDIAAIRDRRGRQVGYVETDQDITAMLERQKAEAELVDEIRKISHLFVTETKQISDNSQTLAQGATEQAATIEELSSAISEISGTTKENTEIAAKAAMLAGTIMQSAEKGSRQMDEMMSAVREINESSNNIIKVIKVIDDIAFQTNILALNAAVEAARAGQHGKGFAVVAEEVRNLASKSANAAKETGELIADSASKAELGSRIAGETSASLTEIVQGINESSELINKIAETSKEQSTGIAHIDSGVEQVAQVVMQNSAAAEENAASSEEMRGQVDILESLLESFRSEDKKPQALKPAEPGQNL